MKWRATAASWFSTFFEKALVNLVNRRMDIRISYATSMENIKKGLDRLENFVKSLK